MGSSQLMLLGSLTVPPVYATWNASDKGANITLNGSNLVYANAVDSTWNGVRATISKSAGKWYWEHVCTTVASTTQLRWGLMSATGSLVHEVGWDVQGWSFGGNGFIEHNSATTDESVTFANGDIGGVAWDADAGKLWFSKNNVWIASGDPSAGTNPTYSSVTGTLFPAGSASKGGVPNPTGTLASGPTLTYTPPTGFSSGVYP